MYDYVVGFGVLGWVWNCGLRGVNFAGFVLTFVCWWYLVCLGFCWFASPAEFGFCRVGVLSLLWVVGVGYCICGGLLVILYSCVFYFEGLL